MTVLELQNLGADPLLDSEDDPDGMSEWFAPTSVLPKAAVGNSLS
jgi:hypothetical protein